MELAVIESSQIVMHELLQLEDAALLLEHLLPVLGIEQVLGGAVREDAEMDEHVEQLGKLRLIHRLARSTQEQCLINVLRSMAD